MKRRTLFQTNGKVKIWLDDERDPEDPLIQDLFGSCGDEIWLKTAEDAISLIKNHPDKIQSVSLDNDLGDGFTEGYEVARFIEESAFLGKLPKIELYAHTMNPVAKMKMEESFAAARNFWNYL